MCGLVGVFGESVYQVDEEFFKDGLIVSQLRGADSTGIGIVAGKKYGATVLKAACDSSLFVTRKDVADTFKGLTGAKILLGHTRWATMGSIIDKNAHPFIHGHIMLAHNGGIWNKEELDSGHKFDVDSEAICHSIAKIGAEETLKTIKGNFALTYYDYNKKTFNIIRNGGRPLALGKHKNRNTYYYASESGMLSWLADRNRIELDKIVDIPEGKLISFDITNGVMSDKTMGFAKDWSYNSHGGGFGSEQYKGHGGTPNSEAPFTTKSPDTTTREPGSDDSKEGSKSTTTAVAEVPDRQNTPTITYREIFSRRRQDAPNPPHGSGALYLARWGLAINDTVQVFLAEIDNVTPKFKHLVANAVFCSPVSVEGDLKVRGFTEEQYAVMKTDDDTYYTYITQCYWNGKEYEIGCHGLFPKLPPGSKAVEPSELAASKKPHIKPKTTKEVASGEVITVDQLDDEQMMELKRSMAATVFDLVPGPDNKYISITEWQRLTKYGCSGCQCNLTEPLKTMWYREFPLCTECFTDNDTSRSVNFPRVG